MYAVFAKIKHSLWTEIHLNFEALPIAIYMYNEPSQVYCVNPIEETINIKGFNI